MFVASAGALGVAAFGIVDAAKKLRVVGEAGYPTLVRVLGALMDCVTSAYGPDTDAMLRAQYRGDVLDLTRVLRQGARLGLTPANASDVAQALKLIDQQVLLTAAAGSLAGRELTREEKNALGRLEVAIDARIEAAVTLSHVQYAHAMQIWAMGVSLAIAGIAGWLLQPSTVPAGGNLSLELWRHWGNVLIVGLVAVPIAPVAKDLAAGLKSATDALGAK